MNQLLSKIFYDSKTGFTSSDKLYRKAKEIDKSITKRQVDEWYKNQSINQQFSNQKNKFPRFKIASDNPNEWQIDLAFWNKQPILIAVNINSRIGFAKLLRNKQSDTIKEAMKEFISEHDVSALMSDNGSEFTNDRVQKMIKANSIEHANAFKGDHNVLGRIDRFIRTLKSILTKMKEAKVFKRLSQKVLDDAIENYNTTYHSSIKATPESMEGRVMFEDIEHNKRVVQKIKESIPIGSIVRYRLESKTPFDKEGIKFSNTLYEVVGLDGLKMKIRSKNNHILYKPVNDLKIVKGKSSTVDIKPNEIVEVDKILDHKKLKNGKYKYLVKWNNKDLESSWEPQANLRLVNKIRMSDLEKSYWKKS